MGILVPEWVKGMFEAIGVFLFFFCVGGAFWLGVHLFWALSWGWWWVIVLPPIGFALWFVLLLPFLRFIPTKPEDDPLYQRLLSMLGGDKRELERLLGQSRLMHRGRSTQWHYRRLLQYLTLDR